MTDTELTLEEQATNFQTLKHVMRVRDMLDLFATMLLERGRLHDQSKLERPEVELFTEFTSKLASCTYGSDEYKKYLEQMAPALRHHYAKNRHHPEHFKEISDSAVADLERMLRNVESACGTKSEIAAYLEEQIRIRKSSVGGMNLVDVIEMFSDWRAATERHHDGNLRTSIAKNALRFAMSPQLVKIFENTADLFD